MRGGSGEAKGSGASAAGASSAPAPKAVLAAFLALFGALVVAVAVASAASAPQFLVQICDNGSAAGQCDLVAGLATDPATGHVFVSSGANNRIEEFTSWGQFVKAWGWGVRDGAPELETCTEATGCQAGLHGGGAGEYAAGVGGPAGLALDSAGDIYVVDSAFNRSRVEKFNPAGDFELMFGAGVVAGGATGTGNVTEGSKTVTAVKATNKAFVIGQTVTAPNIPAGTTITAVVVGNGTTTSSLTLSKAATATQAGETLAVAEGSNNVATNERQTVRLGANTTGGTFTLTVPARQGFATATTAAIPWNASPAEVQTALENLASIDPGDVAVTSPNPGGSATEPGGPYTIEFAGRLADTDVAQLTSNSAGLTVSSGTKSATVATAQAGASAGEVCTEASGCQAATNGSGPGQFGSELGANGSFIAVDGSDRVYVGDIGRIERFSSAGVWEADLGAGILGGGGLVKGLALDPDGNIYTISQNVPDTVRELDPSGTTLLRTISVQEPQALAIDVAKNLYVVSGESNPHVVVFNESGTAIAEFAAGDFEASSAIAVGLLGDGSHTPGDVYVGNTRSNNGYVLAYGPRPFEPPPPIAPEITDEHVSSVTEHTAIVKAEINPNFWDTEYFVEYGPVSCPSPACTQAPVPAASLSSESRGDNPVAVELTGLEEGTAYHFRFVAASNCKASEPAFECRTAGTDHAFTTPRQATASACPNDALRIGTSSLLPDCRAYEMVSPPQKNSAELAVPNTAGVNLGQSFSAIPIQASASGEAIAYATATSFGADPQGAPLYNEYRSARAGSGWSTDNINPKFEEGYTRDPFVGFSADLSHAAVIAIEPPLTADAQSGVPNLYSRDDATGALTAITTEADRPTLDSGNTEAYCVAFEGASADYSRIYFAAKGALLPGDPTAPNGFNLYEWSAARPAADRVQLVSVLPTGAPAIPSREVTFGQRPPNGAFNCDMRVTLLRHAISADGTRAFWMSPEPFYEPSPGQFVVKPLLARVDGTETVQLDAIQGGSAFYSGEGVYWDASADGSKVFFTDSLALTPGANGTDLYRYNFDRNSGQELENLTANAAEAAEVQGVLGASADGSHVYFVAHGVLDTAPNGRGETAETGQNNLYLWHDGGIRFIARFGAGTAEEYAWSPNPMVQDARPSPDGTHLIFESTRSLTGYDNRVGDGSPACALDTEGNPRGNPNCTEAFVYDAAADRLVCASCNPSGARPLGPPVLPIAPSDEGETTLPVWSTPTEQPRYLSDDGTRAFFESKDALVPRDTNGKQDVYEWEAAGSGSCSEEAPAFSEANGGCVDLISTGKSGAESYLLDASSDGRNVFITTRQQLVPQDGDERYDVYDARVDGGFPYTPPPAPCHSAEGCHGAGTSAGSAGSAGTASFAGRGNLRPRRSCRSAAQQARKLSRRAKKLRRNASRAARSGKRPLARTLNRRARHYAKHERRLSKKAKRCRRANRRASR